MFFFSRTAAAVYLIGIEIFLKPWNQIREASERGTIPQRKGGHTEDTEGERYSLPAMLAQKNGFLCVLFLPLRPLWNRNPVPKDRLSGFSHSLR
jgi:hypothetical protein